MSLQSLLDLSDSRGLKKQGLSEERLKAQLPHLRKLVSFYREYPDYLIDFMKGPDSTFNFYFYQRVFLRIVMLLLSNQSHYLMKELIYKFLLFSQL